MFARNQQEQPEAANHGEERTVIEHRRMADAILEQSGNNACYQLQQTDAGGRERKRRNSAAVASALGGWRHGRDRY